MKRRTILFLSLFLIFLPLLGIQTERHVNSITLTSQINASTNGNSSDFVVGMFKEANFVLKATAKSGTTPTLDVTIQVKDEVTGDYFDLVTFTQLTDIGSELKKVSDGLGKTIRVSWEIGGTSPQWTFTVTAVVKT
ncbi:MAG: hypothetical protein ACFFCW_20735 [Candidatus Hodarchaeota archaeon]